MKFAETFSPDIVAAFCTVAVRRHIEITPTTGVGLQDVVLTR
jgi:hypothetical protein